MKPRTSTSSNAAAIRKIMNRIIALNKIACGASSARLETYRARRKTYRDGQRKRERAEQIAEREIF